MLKVTRQIAVVPKRYVAGDQVHIPILGKNYSATAVKRTASGMIFLFDSCLEKEMKITCHKKRAENGYWGYYGFTWEESDLKKFLGNLINHVPKKIARQMVPFANGDYFRLLTVDEIPAGVCDLGRKKVINSLVDQNKRVKKINEAEASQYWLQSEDDGWFSYVDRSGRVKFEGCLPNEAKGVVPLFILKD